MNLLLRHHFTAGWRNILKYKVQNTISVLCLSIGIVLFAVVYWLSISFWGTYYYDEADQGSFKVNIYQGELKNNNFEESPVTICNSYGNVYILSLMKTVKDVIYCSDPQWIDFKLKDRQGKEHNMATTLRIVSPTWLQRQHLSSALTGKAYGRVKDGTILITDRLRDKYFRKDTNPYFAQGFNPADYVLKGFKKDQKINDIVCTTTYGRMFDDVILVSDVTGHSQKSTWGYVDKLRVVLKDGVSQQQFLQEAKRAMPNYKVYISHADTKNQVLTFIVFAICLFLGATVLLIGLSGYLKMRIQLFQLRYREMALRRCNGAQSYHLFLLLAAELLIIFVLILACALGLSKGLWDYAMPKVHKLGLDLTLRFDLNYFLQQELWMVALTFVVSVLIAYLAVRQVIRQPLGVTAGKSYKPKSRWNNAMQTIQYFVATILFFLVSGISILIYKERSDYYLTNSPDTFKQVGALHGFDTNYIDSIPSVEQVGRFFTVEYSYQQEPKDDAIPSETFYPRGGVGTYYGDTIRAACVTDPAFLKRMGVTASKRYQDINKSDIKDRANATYIPIYTSPQEVQSVCRQLGLSGKILGQTHMAHKPLVKVGYASILDIYKIHGRLVNFYEIHQKMTDETIGAISRQEGITNFNSYMFLFPKAGKYNSLYTDVAQLAQGLNKLSLERESKPHLIYPLLRSVYDEWFKQLEILRMVQQLCFILVIVSMASIILSVYASVSLETRGRQKEVAIRKVNGAQRRDIIWLFSRSYVTTLCIAFALTALVGLFTATLILHEEGWNTKMDLAVLGIYLASIGTIALVTFLTIGQKIYKLARLNAADIVKTE